MTLKTANFPSFHDPGLSMTDLVWSWVIMQIYCKETRTTQYFVSSCTCDTQEHTSILVYPFSRLGVWVNFDCKVNKVNSNDLNFLAHCAGDPDHCHLNVYISLAYTD